MAGECACTLYASTPDVEASYSAIIDEILRASDLNTISAKRIRKGLQERVEHDTTHQKDAITDLIMKRFDAFNSSNPSPPSPSDPIPTVENGTSTSSAKRSPASESALSDLEDAAPPKKKTKKTRPKEDDDAAYARRLQQEENSRMRSTRGGNTKKRAPLPKKKTKKKSSNKVKDEDDSDIASGSGAEKKSPSKKGGFHLSRPQTVKKIWEYVKQRDLQDPADKRQIRCDDAMRAVFKQDRVHMFTMNKILNQNLYAVDEITAPPATVGVDVDVEA
ncbi:hypothetical protein SNOG_03451 [Parastagonospora nodorum SN15]|uniref:Uncharacterized protein n=1 Tax=Phaeosphaeria nodorum (strain SN15 / ATCC MYA-4574 / FGSC 10173) TaxID=321614 RepID=Q0UXR3_PHANO|nr:hypothetical protein SNOG_03451 [Parastagonospora nodorum SN15]EAT88656.2 hypothetical protein SNOG_03451 [Parastagonospora nodorum SN15]